MTTKTLSKFSKKLFTHKNFKTISIYIAALVLCVGGFLFLKNQYNKQASKEIMDTVVGFYLTLNQDNYEAARYFMTSGTENDVYMINLKNKMKAINTLHVSVKKVFPPLVNNKIGLVAYSLDEKNEFNGEAYFFREFAIRFMVKEGSEWKFAARKDLMPYKEDEIEKMLNSYKDFLKDDSFLEAFEETKKTAKR